MYTLAQGQTRYLKEKIAAVELCRPCDRVIWKVSAALNSFLRNKFLQPIISRHWWNLVKGSSGVAKIKQIESERAVRARSIVHATWKGCGEHQAASLALASIALSRKPGKTQSKKNSGLAAWEEGSGANNQLVIWLAYRPRAVIQHLRPT